MALAPTSVLAIRFQRAAQFVSNLPSERIGLSERLRFYALFKIVSTSNGSPGRSVAFWDFEAKAKSDSWKAVKHELDSQGGGDQVDRARLEYISLAKKSGWQEESALVTMMQQCQISASSQPTQPQPSAQLEPANHSDHHTKDDHQPDAGNSIQNNQTILRDDYGFEIGSASSAPDSVTPKSIGDSFAMVTISKMIETPTILNVSDDVEASRVPENLIRLHELIIDKDQCGAEKYLAEQFEENGKTVVQLLLNSFRNGYTALHLACDQGLTEVVRTLLDYGADPTLKDLHDNLTGVELAEEAGMTDIKALFCKPP